jgi:hypothetical protein
MLVLTNADEGQARPDLNVCLATWQALNRGVEAYIVESDAGRGGRARLRAQSARARFAR